MQYELTPLPLSLANPDGTLCKTVKSNLFTHLSALVPQVDSTPCNTPSIYDGMVLFQKLPPTLATFGEISEYLLKKLLSSSGRITFFVTDFYLQNSIKSVERQRRSAIGSIKINIINRCQQKPKAWTKYLQNPDNKIQLVEFLIDDWSQQVIHLQTLCDRELFVTCRDKAYCLTSNGSNIRKVDVPELQSSQEEADTKMFLCTQFAATLGFEQVKIVTVDSDVAILALYFQSKITCNMFLEFGTGNRRVIYDISKHFIEQEICDALPGIHAVTGCDTTSCFNSIGKVKCFKVMESEKSFIDAMSLLGESVEMSDSLLEVLEQFVCRLYADCMV